MSILFDSPGSLPPELLRFASCVCQVFGDRFVHPAEGHVLSVMNSAMHWAQAAPASQADDLPFGSMGSWHFIGGKLACMEVGDAFLRDTFSKKVPKIEFQVNFGRQKISV